MIIKGILDSSLNGQLCIRGFAPIKELARISKPDNTYQRDLLSDQKDEIKEFLDKEEYLFFPEVILSYKVKHKLDDKKEPNSPLSKIQIQKTTKKANYKSVVDGTKITVSNLTLSPNEPSTFSVKDYVTIIELTLDNAKMNSAISNDEHPFHRIDGNHRLSAASTTETSKVDSMVVPFCILLGEDFYNDGIKDEENPTTIRFDKSVKVFFHNINTKTIPLKSEENLKVILDDKVNFKDDELERIFRLGAVLTRELLDLVKPAYFTGLNHIIGNRYRTYFTQVFNKLEGKEIDRKEIVDKVFESLKAIDQLYTENQILKGNNSFGLLTAFLYYHIIDKSGKYIFFKEWVMNNHIFEIEEIKATSIIKIFDKIASTEIKVFVAMPYFEGDSDIVEEYNRVYKDSIDKIAVKYKIKISLYPIMQNKGESQDQIQDIINKIQNCGLFIADVSDNNANVLYEMGWARAVKKPTIIVREESSAKPKSDYANDTYHNYKKTALAVSLGKVLDTNITEVLTKNYGLIKQNE
ncbi:MAG: hypothetical protein ACI91R_002489 [Vicingaceae bacterium]|jgi:hypothetical protein